MKMKTKTKYFLAMLDLISALAEVPVAMWNFAFAKWRFNDSGQYTQKNLFSRLSHWAVIKSIKIRFKIEGENGIK